MRVPIALLLHELPDGSSHVDVLIAATDAPIDDDARLVRAFRAAVRPDQLPPGASVDLDELPAHRGFYLRLDRPIELSDARGRVTPLRQGSGTGAGDACIAVQWNDAGTATWTLRRMSNERWRLETR